MELEMPYSPPAIEAFMITLPNMECNSIRRNYKQQNYYSDVAMCWLMHPY